MGNGYRGFIYGGTCSCNTSSSLCVEKDGCFPCVYIASMHCYKNLTSNIGQDKSSSPNSVVQVYHPRLLAYFCTLYWISAGNPDMLSFACFLMSCIEKSLIDLHQSIVVHKSTSLSNVFFHSFRLVMEGTKKVLADVPPEILVASMIMSLEANMHL